jgi:hypothetical protein
MISRIKHMPAPGRRRVALLGAVTLAATIGAIACSDATGTGSLADTQPPTLALAASASAVDSVITFHATAKDNLGIKRIHVDASGGITATYDTVFTSAVTNIDVPLSLSVPRSVPPGTPVTIVGTVYDGAGNRSTPDTLRLATGNLAPANVAITSPATGSTAIIGKSIIISISGTSKVKVQWLGYVATGAFAAADSTSFTSPLKDSTAVLDTIAIPASVTGGTLTLTPFLRDSLGNRGLGSPITLKVQAASNAKVPPVVTFGSEKRVEVNDTLFVAATDTTGAGISQLGYEIRTQPTGAAVLSNTFNSDPKFTTQQHTFTLQIPSTLAPPFPLTIYVKSFGVTANGVTGYAKLANGQDRVDTLTVVAGVTRPLPNGGLIADAYYHPNHDRLYLTNILRDEIDVFSLSDSSFKPAISVGSRPWGIAVWPHDRYGNPTQSYGDTLLVANSGGTSIGYVDISAAARSVIPTSPEGREVFTYPLPNIIPCTITTVNSTTSSGTLQQKTCYDFSDRPQYIGATCRPSALDPMQCGDVIAVYSTTPTGGQTTPFANQGTVRWENLTRKTSHFMFEQAMNQATGRSDTLEIDRYAACSDTPSGGRTCTGSDSTLVAPYQLATKPHIPTDTADHKTIDSVYYSVVVDIGKLAFRDTTYVRNSGNFRRAIMGEGGPAYNSRVIGYDAAPGMAQSAVFSDGVRRTLANPAVDSGVSRAQDVTDFIANTSARVAGVGINFDGSLSAVRADSIYLLDTTLRLQGTMQTSSSGNPGFDFHPANVGDGIGTPRNSCYLFAASTQPVIEVYENHYYRRVATIPVKSPIIGPIKAAIRPTTGQIILVGATANGVVIVTLPDTYSNQCPP